MFEMFNPRREITIIRRHRRKSKINGSRIKSILMPPKGNYLREFLSITSLHGIMYLGEPNRSLLERIYWIVVIMLVTSLFGWKIHQLYNDWLSSVIYMEMDIQKYEKRDNPFPAITFCSDDQLQNISNRSLKDNVFNKEIEEAINLLYFQQDTNNNVTLKHIDPKHWQHVVENYKVECKNIISKLYWRYEEIHSPCDYFQPIMTTFGICYTLNMIPLHLLYKNNYHQTTSISNHTLADVMLKNKTFWTPETGYSTNATPHDIPWKMTGDNIENCVRLVFDLKNTNSVKGNSSKTDYFGVTLILHNSADIPTSNRPTAYIINRSMLTITITMFYITTSSTLENWTPKSRNCYYEHEKDLKFFKLYTYHNCKLECIANNTLRTCGCNAYYQPRESGTPVCGFDKLECVRKASSISYTIFHTLMNKQINNNNNNGDNSNCKCLRTCSYYKNRFDIVNFLGNWAEKSKIRHDDMATTIIYFGDSNVIYAMKYPIISFNALLGNIGGLFGLFLGCSIISFFEILYFFVIRLYFVRQSICRNKSRIMPNFIHK